LKKDKKEEVVQDVEVEVKEDVKIEE